jgi:hypothetical protein
MAGGADTQFVGVPGPAGAIGPVGPAGVQGLPGMAGSQGMQGAPGQQGSPGSSALSDQQVHQLLALLPSAATTSTPTGGGAANGGGASIPPTPAPYNTGNPFAAASSDYITVSDFNQLNPHGMTITDYLALIRSTPGPTVTYYPIGYRSGQSPFQPVQVPQGAPVPFGWGTS